MDWPVNLQNQTSHTNQVYLPVHTDLESAAAIRLPGFEVTKKSSDRIAGVVVDKQLCTSDGQAQLRGDGLDGL